MKAIHQGKISAQKDLNGQWQIEPVELFRVYPPVGSTQPSATSSSEDTPQDATELQGATVARENELLWKMLADKDDVSADLRARLDAEAEERRKLTLILTDSRSAPSTPQPVEPVPQPAAPRSWWARLLGSA